MPYYPQAPGLYPQPNTVTDAMLADMPDGTVKGRALGAGAGDPGNLTVAQLWALLGNPVFTACRLDYVSTALIRLSRFNGCWLTIDNLPRLIPAAGVDLAPTGLTPSAVYYIWAYMAAGVMTLFPDVFAKAPVLDPRNGLKVHPDNAAFTLVGMASPVAGPQWRGAADEPRRVSSYFNRKRFRSAVGVALSTGTGGAYVNISGYNEFLVWANEAVEFYSLVYYLNASSATAYNVILTDVGSGYSALEQAWAGSYLNLNFSAVHVFATEGLHNAIAQGYQSPGGGAWTGNLYAVVWA